MRPAWKAITPLVSRHLLRAENGSQVSKLRSGRRALKCYLNASEIDRLLDAAKDGPNCIRDYTLVLLTYRHELHPFEAVRLQRVEVNIREARTLVSRANGSMDSQPLTAEELTRSKTTSLCATITFRGF